MPRRLLRDGQIVIDEWLYVAEAVALTTVPLIVPFSQFQTEPKSWLARAGRLGAGRGGAEHLGVLLSPADKVEQLAPYLGHLALVAAEFPGPGEGRGYTQGRLLRERWNFKGELRATGYVRRDQVFFMARCGFSSFELPESELEAAHTAFSTFSAAYQASNDQGLPLKLPRDIPANA
ncbi:MAG TPA: DUF934 domain-containing protein [Steroidobacteraceae bacterium]